MRLHPSAKHHQLDFIAYYDGDCQIWTLTDKDRRGQFTGEIEGEQVAIHGDDTDIILNEAYTKMAVLIAKGRVDLPTTQFHISLVPVLSDGALFELRRVGLFSGFCRKENS